MVFIYNIVVPSTEISSSGFSCSSSSAASDDLGCKNVLSSSRKGWVAIGNGVGSWLKIDFNEKIRVSKIIYRHNNQLPRMCCNQNFKDVLFEFSDGTQVRTALDDTYDGKMTPLDITDNYYRITPPKVSSYLKILIISVHNHANAQPYNGEVKLFNESRFGLSRLAVAGSIERGKFMVYKKSNIKWIYMAMATLNCFHCHVHTCTFPDWFLH